MIVFSRRIWNLMQGYRLLFVVSLLAALGYTAVNIVPPILIRQVIFWATDGRGTDAGELRQATA